MSRELDRRTASSSNVTTARADELTAFAAETSARLPGDQSIEVTSVDPRTGNAAVVTASHSPADEGNYVERALNFLEATNEALGFAPTQPVEFRADPHVQQTSTGAAAVNVQQQYVGINIFQASRKVRFGPDGAIQDTVGQTVTVANPIAVAPQISVTDAVRRAAEHVATPTPDEEEEVDQFGQPRRPPSVDLTGFEPSVVSAFGNDPAQPTVLAAGPFAEEIRANLVWFDLDNELRLSWEVVTALPAHVAVYRTIVDAATGEILYSENLVLTAVGRGQVFRVNPELAPEDTDFPRVLAEYTTQYGLPIPTTLPAGFPEEWVAEDQTVGNTTVARSVSDGQPVRGTVVDGVVQFNADGQDTDTQLVVNMFYLNCAMHDMLYVLGFNELAGNYQRDNFGRGGLGSDAVDARVFSEPIDGVASWLPTPDGVPGVLSMGPLAATGRHTALDSDVVFHEHSHGLTNRLVGGPNDDGSLTAPQSRGMGEGWSDYIACVLNDKIVVGTWVSNNPGGIRKFPYDSSFPDN